MNEFDDELARGLRAAADSVDTSGGNANAAIALGRRRRKIGQVRGGVVVVGLAAVLGGAVLAANRGQSDPDQRVQVADRAGEESFDATGRDAATSSLSPIGAASSGLPSAGGSVRLISGDWVAEDPGDLGHATDVVRLENGTLLALSTAPGEHDWSEGPPAPRIYRSTDGVSWMASQASDRFSPARIAARGDRLFALGTMPSAAAASGEESFPTGLAWSDDNGESWTITQLPVGATGLRELNGWSDIWLAGVAAVHGGVVAAVRPSVWIDANAEFPDLVGADEPWNWTDQGLQLMVPRTTPPDGMTVDELCEPGSEFVTLDDGTPACDGPGDNDTSTLWPGVFGYDPGVTHSYEELGISQELRSLILNRPKLFRVGDDGVVSEVDVPGLSDAAGSHSELRLSDSDGAAVLQVTEWPLLEGFIEESGPPHEEPRLSIFRSADGLEWTDVDAPTVAASLYLAELGEVGGNLVAVAYGETAEVLVHTDEGWVTTRTDELVSPDGPFTVWSEVRSMTSEGIVLSAMASLDIVAASGGYEVELGDGAVLHVLDDRGNVRLVADGEVVFEGLMWGDHPDVAEEVPVTTAAVDDDGSVLQGPDGVTIMGIDGVEYTLGYEAFERATEEMYRNSDALMQQFPAPTWILHSPNGVDWDVVELPPADDPAGHRNVASARLVDGRLVVRVSTYTGAGEFDEGGGDDAPEPVDQSTTEQFSLVIDS